MNDNQESVLVWVPQLAALYAEAAHEDRALAESGLADYRAALL